MSQALSPPTPGQLNRPPGRHDSRIRCRRHITKVFPAPLTSFAPTYMASSASGPYAGCSDFGFASVRI
jgi:hypothetical protein